MSFGLPKTKNLRRYEDDFKKKEIDRVKISIQSTCMIVGTHYYFTGKCSISVFFTHALMVQRADLKKTNLIFCCSNYEFKCTKKLHFKYKMY